MESGIGVFKGEVVGEGGSFAKGGERPSDLLFRSRARGSVDSVKQGIGILLRERQDWVKMLRGV